jgi:hypothetical protein
MYSITLVNNLRFPFLESLTVVIINPTNINKSNNHLSSYLNKHENMNHDK